MKKSIIAILWVFILLAPDAIYCQECSPNLQEIYNFPIGSEFQYRITSGGESPYKEVRIENYKVTNKWIYGDTLFYARQGVFEYTRFQLYPTEKIEDQYTGVINDIVSIVDSARHCLNACSGDLVCVGFENCYSYIKIEDAEKTIGGETNLFTYNENDSLVCLDFSNPYNFQFKQVFKEGAGLQMETHGNIMHYTISICEGSLINGIRTGIGSMIRDSFDNDPLLIYPNIIRGNEKINIVGPKDYKMVFLVSTDGRIVPLAADNQGFITLDDVPNGVYYLKFVFEDHNTTRMVIKN